WSHPGDRRRKEAVPRNRATPRRPAARLTLFRGPVGARDLLRKIMTALHSLRWLRVGLVLGLVSLLVSSCIVDTSGLVFDDEAYEDALGAGGDSGTGGGGNLGGASSGGLGGSSAGGSGGSATGGSATGGMGGSDAVCEANEMQCSEQQVEL